MNSADSKRALEILDGAHGLSADEVALYLDRVCGEDSLLRREVLSYLDYDTEGTVITVASGDGGTLEIPATRALESRYDLGDEIAAGGIGVIRRAFDNNIRRSVAIKVLRSDWEDNADVIRRFLQEAQIGGQLQHPGIAPVYEIGRLSDDRPFIAMKLVRGDTLEDLLSHRQHAADDQAKFLGIFEQICQAIAYAHTRGVIHRDLKPSNVMVGEFGEVQVMDWGIAKLVSDSEPEAVENQGVNDADAPDYDPVKVDTDGSGNSTRVGQLMGTPAYMAPEQSIGRADKAADVFSLGVMLCEMLTGKKTTEGADAAGEQLDRCGCDRALAELAKDCLRRNEADRPRDAGVVAERVSAHLNAIQSRLKEAEIATFRAEVKAEEERKRRIRTLWTIAAVATLLLIAASAIAFVRHSVSQHNLRERTKTMITALSTSRGILVPRVIEDLQDLPSEMVLPELSRQFDAGDEIRRLRLAYGLASYGDVQVDLLVSHVASVSPDEVDNFVQALGKSNDRALFALEAAAEVAETDENWGLKARLAMLALQLEAPSLAMEMCRPQPDPIRRSLFIEQCTTWHGDLTKLAFLVADVGDSSLRSAIALSVGGVPETDLTLSDRWAWESLLSNWFQTQTDTGTHSAAGWALRQRGFELPALAASNQPSEEFHWYLNSVGMTMLKLPAGSFARREDEFAADDEDEVVLPRSFLVADCEVTRAQFLQFIDDAQCPQEEKPVSFELLKPLSLNRVFLKNVPTEQHPVSFVTWFAAVRYCNWLSRKEGLPPCYQRTGEKQKLGRDTFEVWKLAGDANGYRLPTEAEWEYACRAGAETVFHFGNDTSLLDRYAVHRADRALPAGTKMPNAWGLFDTHGNLWEWCQDWNTDFAGDLRQRTPHEFTQIHRAERGGGFRFAFTDVRSAIRISVESDSRGQLLGFRVARSCP